MDHSQNHNHQGQMEGDSKHGSGQHPGDSDSGKDHQHGMDHSSHELIFRRRFWISTVLSIPVILFSQTIQGWLGFDMPTFPGSTWIVPVFSLVVFLVGGIPFIQMAVPEFKDRSPGMMALITLAILVAFIYSLAGTIFSLGESFYWELVTLIDIMLLGHWIEMRSVRQASSSLDELAKLLPDEAERIRQNGDLETVPVSELQAGDLVLVRPGESVPADGVVQEGESHLNEAMITGESKLVLKQPSDEVIAGTINEEGSLRIEVSATGDETALAGIMRLVQDAQNSKSRTQLLADRAAGWLFYIALGAAAITAVAWTLAAGFGLDVVKRVTTVLVIACPHALGLAVPLVVAISTSRGAEHGILVRDRIALEEARKLDAIVFDKTGTLTEGKFGVTDLAVSQGSDGNQALALAAALEGDSEHLIARAIRQAAEEKDLSLPAVSDFQAIKGRGVRGTVDGQLTFLGGPQLLNEQGLEPTGKLGEFKRNAASRGETVVFLIQGEEFKAAFSLADLIRPESKDAVEKLQQQGLEVIMLTGDSEEVAKSVADELGIDRYFAEVLPDEKDRVIQDIQKEGKRVAMVGDGVNDAPALTRADIGIAIGSGTDVAVESAGLILVKSNPRDILRIVNLSNATYRKMVQNLIWAAGYNVFALPLAAGILAPIGILLSPAVGALLMSLSTVIVAVNAQLLKRVSI
ncbi:MAG: heavy metal translocating P-type ATPase [Anaerolineales bacterium]